MGLGVEHRSLKTADDARKRNQSDGNDGGENEEGDFSCLSRCSGQALATWLISLYGYDGSHFLTTTLYDPRNIIKLACTVVMCWNILDT